MERTAALFHIPYIECHGFIVESGMEFELVHPGREVTGMDNTLVFSIEQPEGYFSVCPCKVIPDYLTFLPDGDPVPCKWSPVIDDDDREYPCTSLPFPFNLRYIDREDAPEYLLIKDATPKNQSFDNLGPDRKKSELLGSLHEIYCFIPKEGTLGIVQHRTVGVTLEEKEVKIPLLFLCMPYSGK